MNKSLVRQLVLEYFDDIPKHFNKNFERQFRFAIQDYYDVDEADLAEIIYRRMTK